MLKRLTALLSVLALLCSCAMADGAREQLEDAYAEAALMMVEGDYADAAEAFAALSGYSDAPQMAIYCRGLALVEEGELDTAVMAFTALDGYKDSAVKTAYYDALSMHARAESLIAQGRLTDLEAALPLLTQAEATWAQLTYLPEAEQLLVDCRRQVNEVTADIEQLRQAHQYTDVRYADDGHFFVKRDGKWGLIDTQGNLVSPCVMNLGEPSYMELSCGLVWSRTEQYDFTYEFQLCDLEGREVVPGEWRGIGVDTYGIMTVDAEGAEHVFSLTGEEKTPPPGVGPVDFWRQVADDCVLLMRGNEWAMASLSGELLRPWASGAFAGCLVTGDKLWVHVYMDDRSRVGLVTLDGRTLLETEYVVSTRFFGPDLTEYMALTAPDGTTAAYAPDGQRLFEDRWGNLSYAGDELFAVWQDDLMGFVDLQGREVVPCMYMPRENHFGCPFSGGCAVVHSAEGYAGVIARTGRVVVPCEWETAVILGGFVIAWGEDYGSYHILNLSGELLMTLPTDENAVLGDNCFAVLQDGFLNIYDDQGRIVY